MHKTKLSHASQMPEQNISAFILFMDWFAPVNGQLPIGPLEGTPFANIWHVQNNKLIATNGTL
jgi:hypothetical protein